MNQAAQYERGAHEVKQPRGGLETFGERHQKESEGYIFGKVGLDAHAPKHFGVAAVAERDPGITPGANDPDGNQNEQRR